MKPHLFFSYFTIFLLFLLYHSAYHTCFILSISQPVLYFYASLIQVISFANMSCFRSNHSVMYSFMALLDTHEHKRRFNYLVLSVAVLFMWVGKVAVRAAKGIMKHMKEKVSKRSSDLNESQFLAGEKLTVREIRAEQAHQAVRS